MKDLFWLLARSRLIFQFNIGVKLLFSIYVVVLLVVSLLVTERDHLLSLTNN